MIKNKTTDTHIASMRSFIVLKSYNHFRTWFLDTYDFSMFTEEDIESFLQETQPLHYPCIPYYSDPGTMFPEAYLSISLLNFWISHLLI